MTDQKTQIFVIEYDESKEEEIKNILTSKSFADTVGRINLIGEITSPYKGDSRLVDDLLDDIFLVSLNRDSPNNDTLNALGIRIRAKRCFNVRKILINIDKSTDPDLAHIACHHIEHCAPCQMWAGDTLKVCADKELQSYVADKLS